MAIGIDLATDSGRYITELRRAGVSFVGRYYRSPTSRYPALSASEVRLLSSSGIDVVAIWESASTHASYFSYVSGVDDSTSSYHQARLLDQPPGSTIYFAVDYDASSSDIAGPITAYFTGIAAGFDAASRGERSYRIGGYGSGRVCRSLLGAKHAACTWLAASRKWAGGEFSEWNIKQGLLSLGLTFDHDSDESQGDYGAFKIS
jgi:hypothetical protein